ncbi:hypothetical protein ACLB1G_21950 [Oxalobacteraceae bacterium A2-2]
MMSLNTANGASFGPFQTAQPVDGGWLCDGIFYPTAVIGPATIKRVAPPPNPQPANPAIQ